MDNTEDKSREHEQLEALPCLTDKGKRECPHHVTAARPQHGEPVTCRHSHQAPGRRRGAVALPVLHVPPGAQRLDCPDVVEARDVVRRRHPPPDPTRLPPHLRHRAVVLSLAAIRRIDDCGIRVNCHRVAAVVD